MQEDEGFDNNQKLEFVEFNYQPLSIQLELRKYKQKALQTQRQGDGQKYLPLKDTYRQQCSQSVIVRELKNIVFNNFNHEVGLQQNQIIFDTDFQSSNLQIALKRKYLEYQLYLRPDTNTNSHFQWFFFKVKCNKAKKLVHFTIKNFIKANMLYAQGLRPFFRSNKGRQTYLQLPTEVKFYENDCEEFYSLKFHYHFEHDGELVQFCSQPPYTYTRMIEKARFSKGQMLTLCKSPLHKKVPYYMYNHKKPTKAIGIVIARQHPGETVGSWMMEGFLNKLETSISDSIMWVVFPMINVDGVILGNNRTGMAGYDYNRFWNLDQLQKKEKIFPEIVAIVEILKNLRKKFPKKIKLFLDLHGHSSQPNVFSYGPPHEQSSQFFYLSRVFPELMSRKNQNFRNQQCSYAIRPDKKNTARSLLYNYFGIPFSYTIEGSFGLMQGKNVGVEEFLKIGEDLAQISQNFICNYIIKDKNGEVSSIVDFIKEKFKENNQQAEEFDSGSEDNCRVVTNRMDSYDKANKDNDLAVNGQQCKPQKQKIITQISSCHRESWRQSNGLQLFKVERVDQSINQRYRRISERKRNQTEIHISSENKRNFLPKIKQSFASRQKIKSTASKQVQNSMTATATEIPTMMNIKEIQKRLFRLKNSRIGKNILIINAYGV